MSKRLPESIRCKLPYLLAKTHQRQLALFERHTEAFGISGREYATLLVLEAHERLWQSEIAEALGLDRTTVTYLVDSLEKRGWLQRRRDPADRRAHAISLTASGAAALGDIRPAAEAAVSDMLAPLDAAEQDQLRQLLTRLLVG